MMNKYFQRNIKINDTDICTSATPDEVHRIFKDGLGISVLNTGIKHGTVSLVLSEERLIKLQEKSGIRVKWANINKKDKEVYEITTYRIESGYSDGRHPDTVDFTINIEDDLVRRDFTINAMAYCEGRIVGVDSAFNDIKEGVIRCVGNPEDRFNEDPLRILRAFRFQAKLGFSVDRSTLESAHKLYKNLDKISKERIHTELIKAFSGKYITKAVVDFRDIIGYILSPLNKTIGFVQNNPNHKNDVYTHLVKSLEAYIKSIDNQEKADYKLALAVYLHDIGKPECVSYDDKGVSHFYNHASIGSELVNNLLKSLRFSNSEIKEIVTLVKYHELSAPNKAYCKRLAAKIGEELFERLIVIRHCDIDAQSDYNKTVKQANIVQTQIWLDEIIKSGQALSLKDLAITGSDIIELGVPAGKQVGILLKDILNQVVEDKLENSKESLIGYISKKVKGV